MCLDFFFASFKVRKNETAICICQEYVLLKEIFVFFHALIRDHKTLILSKNIFNTIGVPYAWRECHPRHETQQGRKHGRNRGAVAPPPSF